MTRNRKAVPVSDKPVFDFSKVERSWQMQLRDSMTQVSRIQLELMRPAIDDSAEARNAHIDQKLKLMDEMQAESDRQKTLLAQVLVSVPREWMFHGAPDPIQFESADDIDWIISGYQADLLEMLRNGEAQKQAKN